MLSARRLAIVDHGAMLEALRGRIRDRAATRGGRRPSELRDLSGDRLEDVREQVRACLDARGGEVSARARAVELGTTYLELSDDGRRTFLHVLASADDVDSAAVDAAIARRAAATDDEERRGAERELRATLEPPRLRLLAQFNALRDGVSFLVELRADALRLGDGDPALVGLADDLRDLLRSWFDAGFLELRRITWDSPASLLEKLARYEAVHTVRGWDDLKNRLEADRRLFAFFHPSMPGEPLIFVEVALVRGMATQVTRLLDERAPVADPEGADTAIFYSISNAQAGLVGISFGGFLIKRVVDVLRAELPRLRTFATLSPLPGFRRYVREGLESGALVLTADERKDLAGALGEPATSEERLLELLGGERYAREPRLAAALQPILERWCAAYLLTARRDDGRALDPVAHFHLANGARVEQIDWLGDPSAKGLRQSFGLMVNYRYALDDIEKNHEAYAADGTAAASGRVAKLLPGDR
jgi:malonyl-CoA decarboxylase